MSVVALFRGKWGQKAQDSSEKHRTTSVQPSHEDDEDEDESRGGFSRETIRRNSRFYRSMRKKRLAAGERTPVHDTAPAGCRTQPEELVQCEQQ